MFVPVSEKNNDKSKKSATNQTIVMPVYTFFTKNNDLHMSNSEDEGVHL